MAAKKSAQQEQPKTLAPAVPGNLEQVGFHKGSLTTLAKEREELRRMLGIVEQLMHMHIKALKDLGIDLEKETVQNPTPAQNQNNR